MVLRPVPARCEPLVEIASGGMATVYLGTRARRGESGAAQLVAIKRPHQHLQDDPAFRRMLLTEARVVAGLRHANVLGVREVEEVGDSLQLVLDYVAGAPLGDLIAAWAKGGPALTPAVAVRVVLDACAGLHAAHELRNEAGRPLDVVHRDVSPQNVLVGADGVARVGDFGIAKCADASVATARGSLKGRIGYMAPEYVRGKPIDRRVDVFALGVVLWESLAGTRLFRGATDGETLERLLAYPVPLVSEAAPHVGTALDDVVRRALARDRDARFATAAELAAALEEAARPGGLVAGAGEVGAHVRAVAGAALDQRARLVEERLGDARPRAMTRAAGVVALLLLLLLCAATAVGFAARPR